ncbi:DMT family transporter [Erythrobacter sp. F6033]|uniref:DMT family transporter n=1 Tax=Erythrobacter sp. F6033 TaxID=2926401 RepID=UPI001FF5A855|nr:DMT family transporter [Erythrobacter sp. F6033]MCK0128889.1 DMT family transporter [Erythrobacter sp. F6033]
MDGSVARPRPMLAIGLRLLTAVVFATMGMLVKLGGERGVHLVEMLFWRQIITFALITAGLVLFGKLATVRTKRIKSHASRAALGGFCMFFVYGAVLLLPLAEATTLSYTAPFFAVVIAVTMFGEKVGLYRSAAVLVGFCGVVIIMQPGNMGEDITLFGVCVALAAAAMVAMISFQIQDLNKTESPWSIIFWFTALSSPVFLIAMPFFASAHDTETWGIIVAMALSGALAQVLLTSSLRFGSAGVILLIDYTSLLWATWYGYSIFDRAPSTTLWLGAPLIIGAGLLIAWRERQLARAKAQPIAE